MEKQRIKAKPLINTVAHIAFIGFYPKSIYKVRTMKYMVTVLKH